MQLQNRQRNQTTIYRHTQVADMSAVETVCGEIAMRAAVDISVKWRSRNETQHDGVQVLDDT